MDFCKRGWTNVVYPKVNVGIGTTKFPDFLLETQDGYLYASDRAQVQMNAKVIYVCR